MNKSASTNAAVPGQTVRYTITVDGVNPASFGANQVFVTDVVPSALTNIKVITASSGVTAVAGSQVTWRFVPTGTNTYSCPDGHRGHRAQPSM